MLETLRITFGGDGTWYIYDSVVLSKTAFLVISYMSKSSMVVVITNVQSKNSTLPLLRIHGQTARRTPDVILKPQESNCTTPSKARPSG